MIKKLIFYFALFYSIGTLANGNDHLNALETCLFQRSLIDGVNYSPIDTGVMITDDSYSESGEARYVEYNGASVGYGESKLGAAFYNNKKFYPLSKSKVIETGLPIKTVPKEIDYSVSEWGSISVGNKRFICVNVPFPGVGHSGKHQDIRNVFVYDINGSEIYYTVGDVNSKVQ